MAEAEAELEVEPETGERGRSEEQVRAHRIAALRLIRQYPDPALRVRANAVAAVDDELRDLVDRMADVMERAHGAGLAAPQIGVLRRVLIYRVGEQLRTLVNPELADMSEEQASEPEGCLSLLGGELQVPVARHLRVLVRGLDRDGSALEFEAEGMEARVIQHEVDHLDGVLMIDRTPADERRAAMRELRLSM